MTKRQNQIDVFKISTEKSDYIVTLERLKNDSNGNGRYKAVICFIESNVKSFYNAVYTFTGHYFSEYDEAKWVVGYYEKENKDCIK